jgi:hypothetical protein
MRLEFEFDDLHVSCITTDLSIRGAFLNSQVTPPPGRRIWLKYCCENEPVIIMKALVIRVVTPTLRVSGLRGMAVEIEEITSPSGREGLNNFLRRFLNCPEAQIDEDRIRNDEGAVSYKLARIPIVAGAGNASRYLQEELLRPARTVPDNLHSNEEQLRSGLIDVNRRSCKRAPVYVDVTYYINGMPHLGTVLNISRRGLFIRTAHAIPEKSTSVVLKFPVAEAPDPQYVRVIASVRRAWNTENESLPGFALRFEHVDEMGNHGIFRTYLDRFDKKKRKNHTRTSGFHYAKIRRIR